MKKLFCLFVAVCLVAVTFCACGNGGKAPEETEIDTTGFPALKVGIPTERLPQEEIMGTFYSRIAAKGYRLEFVEFESSDAAADALAAGKIDVSFVSEKHEFTAYDKANPDTLLNLGPLYYYPYGIYLCNFESKDTIADGATIAVPSDAQGLSRALNLLAAEGYIALDEGTELNATLEDITENKRGFKFEKQGEDVIAANLAGGKADIAVAKSTPIIEAGYEVGRSAIAIEAMDCAAAQYYATVLMINKNDITSEKYKQVEPLYYSHMMCELLEDYPDGLVVAAFEVSNIK